MAQLAFYLRKQIIKFLLNTRFFGLPSFFEQGFILTQLNKNVAQFSYFI
jgi:hypothetical protein